MCDINPLYKSIIDIDHHNERMRLGYTESSYSPQA